MSLENASAPSFHLHSKRADTKLTLGLALGFGATALVLTAFTFFLFGYYFGRRNALKSLRGGRLKYSAVQDGDADAEGINLVPSLPRSKLRAPSKNRTRTASSYSYAGLTTTDVDSITTGTTNARPTSAPLPTTMQVQYPPMSSEPGPYSQPQQSTTMQVQYPPMSSQPGPSSQPLRPPSNDSSAPQGTDRYDLYGLWHGTGSSYVPPGSGGQGAANTSEGIANNQGPRTPSVYVEPPPDVQSPGAFVASNGSSHPNNLRPGAMATGRAFGHGTPLTQISESSTSSWSRSSPPEAHSQIRGSYSGAPAGPSHDVEMPARSPAGPSNTNAGASTTSAPQSTSIIGSSTTTTSGSSTRVTTPANGATDVATGLGIDRAPTMSKPPSYPYHELSSQPSLSLASSSKGNGVGSGGNLGRNIDKTGEGSSGPSSLGGDYKKSGENSVDRDVSEGSSTARAERRISRVLGPRAASTQMQAQVGPPASPMYVQMPPASPPQAGP